MAGNQLCAYCHQPATYFCVCNLESFCDHCTQNHSKTYLENLHLQLPVTELPSARVPGYRENITNLMSRKTLMLHQINNLDECRKKFETKAEKLKENVDVYQQKVKNSILKLQENLKIYVNQGVEEAKKSFTQSQTHHLRHPIAQELTLYDAQSRLITCITDMEQLFAPLESHLRTSKVTFEATCPGMQRDFQYEGEVEVVGSGYRQRNRGGLWVARVLVCLLALIPLKDVSGNREMWEDFRSYDGGLMPKRLDFKEGYGLESGNIYRGHWDSTSTLIGEEHISGYGTMTYSNGEVYEGYWRQGQRHGSGRLITAKGEVCEGMWRQDEFTGWGECVGNSTVKSGQWKAGELDGFGMVGSSLSITLGKFRESKLNGLGVKAISSREFLIADWENNEYSGSLVEFDSSSVRWGTYKAGVLQGNMTVLYENGVRYVGEWRNGVRHGKGVETYPAEYFTGVWEIDSVLLGSYNYTAVYRVPYEARLSNHSACRVVTYSELKTAIESWLFSISECNSEGHYSGQVNSAGQRHGYGVQNYSDGAVYRGYWANDRQHIIGRHVSAKGDKCEGMWADGQFTGWGHCVFTNGNAKEGQWKDGKLNGSGRIKSEENIRIGWFKEDELSEFGVKIVSVSEFTIGTWEGNMPNGNMLKFKKNILLWGEYKAGVLQGNITVLYENGVRYVGEWRKGMRHGKGVEYYPAKYITGVWNKDNRTEKGEYADTDRFREKQDHSLWTGMLGNIGFALEKLYIDQLWVIPAGLLQSFFLFFN